MNAAVAIFAFNRPDHLKQTLGSLVSCSDFEGREVFVFCDGARNDGDADRCRQTQEVAQKFAAASWNIIVSPKNLGLAASVHKGVSHVLASHDSVIVLEDDLVFAKDFLTFMDEALACYSARLDIFSISGFVHSNKTHADGVFLFPRAGSWGWATWANRWKNFELNNISKTVVADKIQMQKFNAGGPDLSWMLRNQLRGKVNSWAIQWTYFQFINNAVSVYPECSKVKNIGFDPSATHTKQNLSDGMGVICNQKLTMPPEIQLNDDTVNQYRSHYKIGKVSRILNSILINLGIPA